MAELAIGFMSAVGAGAGAIGAGASAIGGLSTVATVLSGVATAGSILMNLQAGKAAQQDAYMSAQLAEVDGAREVAASEQRALEIRREALQKIGAARVAFGASGIDISSDQLSSIEGAIEQQAGFGLEIEKQNQRMIGAETKLRSGQLQIRGDSARAASMVEAYTTGAKGLLSIVKRG